MKTFKQIVEMISEAHSYTQNSYYKYNAERNPNQGSENHDEDYHNMHHYVKGALRENGIKHSDNSVRKYMNHPQKAKELYHAAKTAKTHEQLKAHIVGAFKHK